jgi:multiple sugar transport system permease protein
MEARLGLKGGDRWWALLMLGPTLLGAVFGTVGSLLASVLISLTNWDNVNPPKWIGLANYSKSFSDPRFWETIGNTLRFSALYVPACIAVSLFAAMLLNRRMRGRGFFRAAFFFPSLTSAVAVALVFSWIYAKDDGLLNRGLALIGLAPVAWMGKESILYSVTMANVWGAVGEGMIVFLAALQSVPAMYYEAATIDGAGRSRQFFKITLPMISPAIFFQVVVTTVNALQAFEYIYMLTRRTQGESIMATTVYLIYRNGFRWFSMGLASAQAVLLSGVIILCMAAYFSLEKKLVSYE